MKACINGARRPDEHPALSARAEDLAAEAARAVAAGAGALHVHPKDADGSDSLRGDDVDRVVAAIRSACPGVPLGVTTGAWSAPDVRDRLAAIASWRDLPDFASVNWHEDGADDVAGLLLERGIDVEAGVWNADGLGAWQRSIHRDRCLRVLVELPDINGDDPVRRAATELVDGVRQAAPTASVLLHGEERSTWPALRSALAWGLDTRIGLEDTLRLPDGAVAAGNAALVAAARDR